MVTVYTLGITGGQFIAGLVCGAFSTVDEGWRQVKEMLEKEKQELVLELLFQEQGNFRKSDSLTKSTVWFRLSEILDSG